MRIRRSIGRTVQVNCSVGYFKYIAKSSFVTTPTGERMFYRGWPFSRPYVVPDSATEGRLYAKQLWMARLLLGTQILGWPLLFSLVPNVTKRPLVFFGCLGVVMVAVWQMDYLVFHRELRGLRHARERVSLRILYADMAARRSTGLLILGLLGSLLFVAGGVWILVAERSSPIIAWVCIGFFALLALSLGYTLRLKRSAVSE